METPKYTAAEKRKLLNQAIKDGGFYGNDNRWNAIVTSSNDNKIYRHRVETLIIRNNKEVFLKKRPDNTYVLPGGSTERDIPDIDQAVNECREEARINVKNIMSTGLSYKKMDSSRSKTWAKNLPVHWDGYIVDIYIAEFDNYDHRHVDDVDKDPYIQSGRFYSFKECFKIFRKEHRESLSNYLRDFVNNKPTKENNLVTESYFTNYFKNAIFLKKLSSNNPEITKDSVDMIIKKLNTEYKKHSKDTKEVKRDKEEFKKTNATNFYPVFQLGFGSDAQNNDPPIQIAYTHVEDYSAGAASQYTDDDGVVHRLVLIHPSFFKSDEEMQKFILLHEIGHIRLGHTEPKNYAKPLRALFDKNFDIDKWNEERRINYSAKGKVLYEELNADAYALLSGASLYTLLQNSYKYDFSKDNKNGDGLSYTAANNEAANRYRQAYKKYDEILWHRYCKDNNIVECAEVYELADDLYYEFTTYDLVKFTITEFVYNNENISDMCNYDKEILHDLVSDIVIEKEINSNDEILCEKYEYNQAIAYESGIKFGTVESRFETIDDFFYNSINADRFVKEKVEEYLCELTNEKILNGGLSNEKSRNMYLLERAMKRSKLSDSKFGIPELRKYPLESKKHVYSAIKLFGHYADTKYAGELAKNILNAMKKYHISKDIIGEKNKLRNYI